MTDIDDEVFEPEQEQPETPSRQGQVKRRRSYRFVDTSPISTPSKVITRSCSSAEEEPETTNEKYNKHVRTSLKNVRNDIYMAMAELDGYNFSYYEMQIALKVIANRCFGCKWKLPDCDSDTFDLDTAVATKIRPYIYRVNNLKIIHLKK